jgi:hypothetical protein
MQTAALISLQASVYSKTYFQNTNMGTTLKTSSALLQITGICNVERVFNDKTSEFEISRRVEFLILINSSTPMLAETRSSDTSLY